MTTVGASTPEVAAPQSLAAPTGSRPHALGPHVTVFGPEMPVREISAALAAAHARTVDTEMGAERLAFLFRPGTYGTDSEPLHINVGYYTEIAGLGASPSDVVINGTIEVYNRRLDADGADHWVALVNFWRIVANLTLRINTARRPGSRSSANFWAVSQAVSMRRLDISGGLLSLMDFCTDGPHYASGGFLGDCRTPFVINGSQQQWLTRNCEIDGWSNGVWNQVFAGVVGAPADTTFPGQPYTTLERTPLSREKPYLFLDTSGNRETSEGLSVRVPSAGAETRGITWAHGPTPGRTIPLADFFVARPTDSARAINDAMAAGRHLLLTPGVYEIDATIAVDRADTVVLGIGLATLTAVNGVVPMAVADVPGVIVAGVMFDAGTVESPALLRIGSPRTDSTAGANGKDGQDGQDGQDGSEEPNPTTLSDVFFRVGGAHIAAVDVALEVNSDNVLIDHIWVWRADHGAEGPGGESLGDDGRWVTVRGRNGVVVNGHDVTATGLFVEHFQEHNLVWNGERGRVVFFQNELPYDPPAQTDWTSGPSDGWAAYKVADHVATHEVWGAGVYVFNRHNPSVVTCNGFEVPVTPGVKLHHLMTVNLSAGAIDHVVNGVGAAADMTRIGQPVFVPEYP